jgi:hypothetical protein
MILYLPLLRVCVCVCVCVLLADADPIGSVLLVMIYIFVSYLISCLRKRNCHITVLHLLNESVDKIKKIYLLAHVIADTVSLMLLLLIITRIVEYLSLSEIAN